MDTAPATPERLLVKWQTPADEALGTALLAHAFVERGLAPADRICIAAPNMNWAHQMRRACDAVGQQTCPCIARHRLDRDAAEVLAKLDMIAHPGDDAAKDAWCAYGHTCEDADSFIEAYAASRGFTLVRAVGLEGRDAFKAALLHVQGDEDAEQLHRLVVGQLAEPTLPVGAPYVAVSLYDRLPAKVEYLFLVGCVDGLIPGPAAYEADTQASRDAACDAARDAFMRAYKAAEVRTVVSSFMNAEVGLAEAAHIRSSRKRVDAGREYAVCRPSPFLTELRTDRPTTTGGQTLLRAYGLN